MLMPTKERRQREKSKAVTEDALKSTDTLPSEADDAPKAGSNGSKKEESPAKKKKIIGLMGIEQDEGPPGSTHG